MKLKIALLAAAGSLAMVSAAQADEKSGYYGALGAGIVLENEIDFENQISNSIPNFDTELELDSAVTIYGALGKYLGNGVRGELELANRVQDVTAIPGDGAGFAGFPSEGDLGDITVTTLMLNVFKDFNASGRVSPYLGVGLGAAKVDSEFDNLGAAAATNIAEAAMSNELNVPDSRYEGAVQGMAGISVDFTESLMLDVRYRYLHANEVEYEAALNNVLVDTITAEYTGHEVTAGLRWNFGAPAPVATVAAPAPVQFKTCFDGSRIPVTEACPVEEEPMDVVTEMDPLVVYFDYDRSDLSQAAETIIRARATEARENGVTSINVSGNTDTAGSASYNQRLSARRAAVVRDELIENGVSSNIINVEALGESNPAKETGDGVAEPLNRRTEVGFGFSN